MVENANQHFVPQFYLRNFSKDRKSINIALKKNGRIIDSASIKGQCSKRKYYDRIDGLDDLLRILETQASKWIAKVIEDGHASRLSNQGLYEAFLCFLTTQMYRTPQADTLGEAFHTGLHTVLEGDSIETGSQAEEILQTKLDHVDFASMAVTMYPVIFDLRLCHVRCGRGSEFITSDNPVILMNKAGEQGRVDFNTSLAASGLIIVYPISPKDVILLYDGGTYQTLTRGSEKVVWVNDEIVERFNQMQVNNARDAVFFQSKQSNTFDLLGVLEDRSLSDIASVETVRVRTETRDGREIYLGLRPGDNTADDELILFKNIPVSYGFTAPFLKYRQRAEKYETGTGAGTLRSKIEFDIAEAYIDELKSRRLGILSFTSFREQHL